MINPVNSSSVSSLAYKPAASQKAATKKEDKKSGDYDSAFSVDISISASVKKGAGLSTDEIESIKNQADLSSSSLKDLVEKLIVKQRENSNPTLTLSIELLGATGAASSAQADGVSALTEDSEWGVDAVSDRLIDFAKSISGGDKSKIDMLRDAIDKGFASAQKTLGGKLPDISSQTYDAVMSKLDDWAAETDTAEAAV